ncbi:MAG: PRC and DUF2382 domain-containing protein [Actinobacteria bacterium]|nr:PRC and DUF2382 domain-containing protein [Actinomycetota bacterium]
MSEFTIASLSEMRGETVYDRDGEKIGKVEEIFYDEGTQRPEWLAIGTGFFGMKRVLVPLAGARAGDDGLTIAYSKDQVQDSPDIDTDEISSEHEQSLSGYYGGASTATGEARERSLTRSEEELRVGKRDVEAGAVRLRKWVETEPAEVDVDLKRETARVTREPIDEEVGGADFKEDEIEVPLHAEEPVVEKRVVAKERVAVEKGVVTDRETISDELRKERVEVDEDEAR